MITKDDIKVGVKLKLLDLRGSKLGYERKQKGSIIKIKSVALNSFEDTDGYIYSFDCLYDFDLATSSLPTDRPLTYDETQMLQEKDVVRVPKEHWLKETIVIVSKVTEDYIDFETGESWFLTREIKSANGKIYFVSRPEVKEEKKEEVVDNYTPTHFNCRTQSVWRYTEPVTQVSIESALKEIRKEKSTKSVSQILYGR